MGLRSAEQMKYFIKLNALSVLYAFMLFIVIELPLNIYRISRISGLVVPNHRTCRSTCTGNRTDHNRSHDYLSVLYRND